MISEFMPGAPHKKERKKSSIQPLYSGLQMLSAMFHFSPLSRLLRPCRQQKAATATLFEAFSENTNWLQRKGRRKGHSSTHSAEFNRDPLEFEKRILPPSLLPPLRNSGRRRSKKSRRGSRLVFWQIIKKKRKEIEGSRLTTCVEEKVLTELVRPSTIVRFLPNFPPLCVRPKLSDLVILLLFLSFLTFV